MMPSRVRGTDDILDLRLHTFLLDQMSKHLQRYNFSQIQTPILEPTSLFVRSLGQETDVVSKEMYTMQTSSGESICLRPEATAGIMRAFFENSVEKAPWKVWVAGSMFRHERPQKGRWREFTQISMEVIDAASIMHDVQFIKMLDVFFSKTLKLENYVLKLNFLGCLEDRQNHRQKLREFLDGLEGKLCETCVARKEKNILRIFDCKNEDCKKLYQNAPRLTDCLCTGCAQEWKTLQDVLRLLSVNYIIDSMLVRGLDYYNKTVFEFTSKDLGAQDAFCGGGRYELGKALEAKQEYPSIGAAIGFGRLLLLLQTVQDKLVIPHEPALHVIIPMTEAQQSLALIMADALQTHGLCVDVLFGDSSIKNMMRKANKMAASHVLILGEDEQKNGTVSIKNMTTGVSEIIKQTDAVAYLKRT